MTSVLRIGALASAGALVLLVLCAQAAEPDPAGEHPAGGLASPEAFDTIADAQGRSAALFSELGKVLTHPRCVNCHPAGDRPRQGDLGRPHQPPVARGETGHGTASMRCGSCHQRANFDPGRMPGHPEWHLAPREMAWEGRSLAAICAQIKDPARNGGRAPEDLVRHIGQDTLVGWAWAPGAGRSPAPGTQAQAGALVAAWLASGAACPAE
ncbi:hypothetical protein OPKNFCMD_1766 [Methylobacterium crusticola]|uniref:Cytochrome c domain-containing protein n=1 Tax=Methylobacterium crusticola TaxID=1697972 RepID=A0ABQ4QUS9_9HYPH|nr:Isoquinoline 1-oxidoreductase subunit [Methylobacterium crusticola]GJD49038.1 hypothetical protein OPKNFCMD_1766 [Methylobacterium crusticola]